MMKFLLNMNIKTLFVFVAIFSITLISMVAHYTLELNTAFDALYRVNNMQISIEVYETIIESTFEKIFSLLSIMVIASLLVMFIMRQKILVPIDYHLNVIKSFINNSSDIQEKKLHYHDEIGQMTQEFFTMKEKLDNDMEVIRQLAEKDSLTGIYNRRTFFKEAQKALGEQAKEQDSSLMILDIDFFKNINDTYGHIIGDKILSHVVHLIEAQLGSEDIFARYGGEEFIILLPHRELKDSTYLAEEICKKVALTPYIGSNQLLRITVTLSIGVALYNQDTVLEDTIKIADEALYKAKESGRNRVEVA